MSYKVVNRKKVVELATQLTIKKLDTTKEANAYVKFLNSGGGFSGFTPSFILNSVNA